MDDEIKQKIEILDKKLEEARKSGMFERNEDKTRKASPADDPDAVRSGRAGSEFLANVIAGGFIGYGIDWVFGTLPMGLMGFMVLGFVNGVLRANAAMKKNNEK